MRAGKLRCRIEIQLATKAADSAGTLIETWATVASNWWADIQPVRAREFVQGNQVQSDITHTVQMRYFAGFTARHRIVWAGRVFNVVGKPINVGERNRWHEFTAVETTV